MARRVFGIRYGCLSRRALFFALAAAGASECAFGQFVYAVDSSNQVAAYSFDTKTKALSVIPGSPFTAGTKAFGVAVDPRGRFAYVANAGSNDLSAFAIDPTTGTLLPFTQSPFAAGGAPSSVAADPTGKFVYVANSGSGNVSAYKVDAPGKTLIPVSGSPFAAAVAPASLAVDPRGKFLYVTNSLSASISAYRIDSLSGALTAVTGSPFKAGNNADALTIDPTGRFVYVASTDSASASVSTFAINAISGQLTLANSPVAVGTDGAISLAVDPGGKLAFIEGAGGVSTGTLDEHTGSLALTAGLRFFRTGVAAAPALKSSRGAASGQKDLSSNDLSAIDALAALLLPTDNPPFVLSLRPRSVAVARAATAADPVGTALVTSFTSVSLRNNFTGGFGMGFTVGATPLNVTALGRIYVDGNNGSHVLKLVTASSGMTVPGGSVTITLPSGTAGQFVYGALASPVTLAANTSYYLVSSETADGDQFYNLGPITETGVVSVDNGEVDWPGIGFYAVGGANSSFGPVNLLYVPAGAPPAVTLSAPAGGATVSGNNVAVTATATAAAGLTISTIQFQLDSVNYGSAVTASPYSITLDTTKLTNGMHTLTAVATDSAFDSASSAPVSITVNNIPTTVSITTPADGTPVSGTQITVTATASPATGLAISSVQFQVDKINYGSPLKTSPYTITLDSTKLSDGTHSLVAVATDSGGTAVSSSPVSISVNNSTTAVAITAPVPAATASGPLTVTAAATARIGLTITKVQFQVDNVNQGVAVVTSPYTITLDSTQLSNGAHSLVALATDSSGSTVASLPVIFTVSNTSGSGAPAQLGTPLITAFTAGVARNNFTGGFGMRFTVGATPLNVTALGRIYIAGNTGSHVVKLVNAASGMDVPGGSVTVSLPSGTPGQFAYVSLAAPVPLTANTAYYLLSNETLNGDQFYNFGPVTPAGVATVNNGAVAWPGIGYYSIGGANSSFGPVNLLYLPAGAPPVVTLTSPAAGTVSGNNVAVTAAATAAAGLTISTVQFQLDNVNYGAAVTASPYTIGLDTTKLTNGTHTLTAVATDSAFDSSTSAPVTITVSNIPTTVSITAPADGTPVSGAQVTVSATASPATGLKISSVQFQVDKINYGAAIKTSPYTITLDSTQLSDGMHSLVAVATDSGGTAVSSSAISIVVNNSSTAVAITSPVAAATVSGTNLTITAAATAKIGLTITKVQFQVDNVNQGSPVTTSPYSITLDSTQLSNGTHSLVALATDSSGITVASLPLVFTVSNSTAPPVQLGTALITGFTAGAARNNFTGGFGMRFTVGSTPLNVTALGRIYIAGNSGTHVVRLVTASSGIDVAGGSVIITLPASGTPGDFVYAPLASPITLTANTSYYLISDESAGGDQFYNLGSVTPGGLVSVDSGEIYWSGIGFYSIGDVNNSFGPVNLLYTTP